MIDLNVTADLARPPAAHRPGDVFRSGETVQRWIGFELAGQLYGVPILAVQEVLAQAEIEPVPGTAAEVMGVINLRGQIVTVVDLRLRLGLAAAANPQGPLIVFDAGSETLAARVDRVAHVRQIADSAIKSAPPAGATPSRAVLGLVTREGRMMTLLDVPGMLA